MPSCHCKLVLFHTARFAAPGFETVCVIAMDVLAPKLLVAPYTAVMECGEPPALRADVLKVAVEIAGPLADKFPTPSVVMPSLKVTVPVGAPAVLGVAVTVAVNVTDCPAQMAPWDVVTVVVVLATAVTVTLAEFFDGSGTDAVIIHGPAVFSVMVKFFVPLTSAAFDGRAALLSVEVMPTVSVTVFTRFQFASTELTVRLKAEPAVCAVGVPVLPGATPGVGVSPGASNCNCVNGPAMTVNAPFW